MSERDLLIRLRGVTKDYGGLRPLRIQELDVRAGQSLALLGLDASMAEVLVNLITGTSLPDTGDIVVMGRPTSSFTDSDDWLRTLDQFGLVSERAVLVEQLPTEQSLAMPISLDLEMMSAESREQVRRVADEVGLSELELSRPTGILSSASRMRLRLGRALVLNPRVLLAEHPNAALEATDIPAFAADLSRIVRARRLASIVITASQAFAQSAAEELLTLQPATGLLKPSTGWRRWFS